jgi:hypothetical protein
VARIGNLSVPHSKPEKGAYETFCRIGLATKGFVYVLVGVLALLAAIGAGGGTVDERGAMSRLAQQPIGKAALLLIGIGLVAYTIWRVVSAFHDTDRDGSNPTGIGKRAFFIAGGIVYSATAFFAIRLGLGERVARSHEAQNWTARLLNAPLGTALVVIIGASILAVGIAQMVRGWKENFREHLGLLPGDWMIHAGKWGHIARGIVFAIIGIFVMLAALRRDPREVRGIGGALDALAAQPFGQVLLGFVAAGLALFGIYSIIESRYRRV